MGRRPAMAEPKPPQDSAKRSKCASCGTSVDAVFYYKGAIFCKKCLRKARG